MVKDFAQAVTWTRKAAGQGYSHAQFGLSLLCERGDGIAKDYVEAYKWSSLAASQGGEQEKQWLAILERRMTKEQIAEGQRLAREFMPRKASQSASIASDNDVAQSQPSVSGTGFIITADGFLVTNEHVVRDAAQIRLVASADLISAKVVKADAANDLALLKAEGRFAALPVAASRSVKLGGTVATVGVSQHRPARVRTQAG